MGKDPRREAQIRSGPGALDSKHPTSYRHGSPLAQIPFPLELGQEGREDNRRRRRGAGWGGHRGGEVGGCCGSLPQRATPSPRPVRVSEAELGARGTSNAVTLDFPGCPVAESTSS